MLSEVSKSTQHMRQNLVFSQPDYTKELQTSTYPNTALSRCDGLNHVPKKDILNS